MINVLIKIICCVAILVVVYIVTVSIVGAHWVNTGKPKRLCGYFHDRLHWHRPSKDRWYNNDVEYSICPYCKRVVCAIDSGGAHPWMALINPTETVGK